MSDSEKSVVWRGVERDGRVGCEHDDHRFVHLLEACKKCALHFAFEVGGKTNAGDYDVSLGCGAVAAVQARRASVGGCRSRLKVSSCPR